MTGLLKTYQSNGSNLSCSGVANIENGIVKSVEIDGVPRPMYDKWMSFYNRISVGDRILRQDVDNVLWYNGRNDIISILKLDYIEENCK